MSRVAIGSETLFGFAAMAGGGTAAFGGWAATGGTGEGGTTGVSWALPCARAPTLDNKTPDTKTATIESLCMAIPTRVSVLLSTRLLRCPKFAEGIVRYPPKSFSICNARSQTYGLVF